MEHVPVSKNENKTDKPFDFSAYNQPEATAVPDVEESAGQPPFDFSPYEPVPTAEEQIAEAERFRTWDFSDKNIAEKGPVRRDMTPDEIYEAGKAEAEKPARQRLLGSGVVRRLVSFGRRK
jgi:hypothetical protein